jgi:hypothetical protein
MRRYYHELFDKHAQMSYSLCAHHGCCPALITSESCDASHAVKEVGELLTLRQSMEQRNCNPVSFPVVSGKLFMLTQKSRFSPNQMQTPGNVTAVSIFFEGVPRAVLWLRRPHFPGARVRDGALGRRKLNSDGETCQGKQIAIDACVVVAL